MGGVVDSVLGGGDDAADAATDAAEIQAQAQREALDYLKEREKLPSAFGDAALKGFGGEFGLELGADGEVVSDGMSIIERAKASPFYQTSIRDAEDAVLRNASATGGLRSGTANENLARANNAVLQNAYNQQLSGLQGIMGMPSNANNIAATMAGIGQTNAQGITAAAQAEQAGNQQGLNNAMGIGTLAAGIFDLGGFSDNRLKTNIKRIGTKNGMGWYRWKWNKKAEALGLSGESEGYMASEVAKKQPEAVGERDGYATINYQMLEAQ
jgi:hypothetical protein